MWRPAHAHAASGSVFPGRLGPSSRLSPEMAHRNDPTRPARHQRHAMTIALHRQSALFTARHHLQIGVYAAAARPTLMRRHLSIIATCRRGRAWGRPGLTCTIVKSEIRHQICSWHSGVFGPHSSPLARATRRRRRYSKAWLGRESRRGAKRVVGGSMRGKQRKAELNRRAMATARHHHGECKKLRRSEYHAFGRASASW